MFRKVRGAKCHTASPVHTDFIRVLEEEPSSSVICSFTAHEHTQRRWNTCRPKCRNIPERDVCTLIERPGYDAQSKGACKLLVLQ